MIGLRVYELKQDKDRDVRENTVLINVSDEVLKLSVMLNKMNALEIPSDDGEMSGSGTTKAKEDFEIDETLDKTLDTTATSDGSDTIIESFLPVAEETVDESAQQVEKAQEVKEEIISEERVKQAEELPPKEKSVNITKTQEKNQEEC